MAKADATTRVVVRRGQRARETAPMTVTLGIGDPTTLFVFSVQRGEDDTVAVHRESGEVVVAFPLDTTQSSQGAPRREAEEVFRAALRSESSGTDPFPALTALAAQAEGVTAVGDPELVFELSAPAALLLVS